LFNGEVEQVVEFIMACKLYIKTKIRNKEIEEE